jgi:hypothetical protein
MFLRCIFINCVLVTAKCLVCWGPFHSFSIFLRVTELHVKVLSRGLMNVYAFSTSLSTSSNSLINSLREFVYGKQTRAIAHCQSRTGPGKIPFIEQSEKASSLLVYGTQHLQFEGGCQLSVTLISFVRLRDRS